MSKEQPGKTQPVEHIPLLLKIVFYPFILIYILISETWKWFINQLVRFIDYVIHIYDKIIAVLSIMFRPVKQLIIYVFKQLYFFTKWVATLIYKRLKILYNVIKQLLSPIFKLLEGTFNLIYRVLKKVVSVTITIFDNLMSILRKVFSPIIRFFTVLANHIKHFLNQFIRWSTEGFKILWHFINYLLTPIKYLIEKLYQHVLVYLISGLKKLAMFLKTSIKGIKVYFGSVIESIKKSIKKIYQNQEK